MELKITLQRKSGLQVLMFLTLVELILGGSGRLATFGGISLRLIILAVLFFFELYFLEKRIIGVDRQTRVLLILLFYFLINFAVSILFNNISDAVNELTGYLPLAAAPFFVGYFCLYDDKKRVKKIIMGASLILSITSIFIWIYCFRGGMSAMVSILTSFLNPYNYGNLDMIGGSIPRLFLKGSVFICIGFLFQLADVIDGNHRVASFIALIVDLVAVVMTFTVGLYMATVIGTLIYIFMSPKRNQLRKWSFILIILLIGIYVLSRFNVLDVINERFSGDYTTNYKWSQFTSLLGKWLENPIVGKGFGSNFTIDYGYRTDTTYSFEVMWAQLLTHTGIIGFLLYAYHICLTIKALYNKYKVHDDQIYLLFMIGVVVLCLESFTNPYMNNAIGIIFYCLCVGIAFGTADERRSNRTEEMY